MATGQYVWPRTAIYAAFGAVAFSFIGATLYTQHRAAEIQASARAISGSAAPAIEALSSARAELETLMLWVVSNRGSHPTVTAARGRLWQDVQRYLDLPYSQAERFTQQEVSESVQGFLEQVDRVERARSAGKSAAPELLSLQEDERMALEALTAGVALSAERAHVAAARIEAIREHSTLLAYLLSGVCLVGAVISAAAAGRAASRHAALLSAYAKLQESRATELELFASRVAHDLTSPLQPVALGLHLLEQRLDADPKSIDLVRRTRGGVNRAKALVDGLLEFARAGARPSPNDRAAAGTVLRGLIEEIQPAANAAQVQLHVEPVPPCKVACAPGVLASIVQNLLRNALKYIGTATTRRVDVRMTLEAGRARFEIKDSGPGLSAELQERVFEPYVRGGHSEQSGLGLGLATVKRLVESHGGEVGVRSVSGAGCTFWFELPAFPGEPPDGWVPSASPRRHSGEQRLTDALLAETGGGTLNPSGSAQS